jgi:hypothetical protein
MKIVIIVDGGVVQNVLSDTEGVNVVLVDHDNLRVDNSRDARYLIEEAATQGCSFDLEIGSPQCERALEQRFARSVGKHRQRSE